MSLIKNILREWAYRVDNGMPNPKNPIHIKELSQILSEKGMSDIKDELIQNLTEADNAFTNPILNRKIKYKDSNNKDKEGLIGNLLRLQKDSPGRKAAEAQLPPEDSEERKQINKDLGSQNQAKPTEPKAKDGKEEEPKPEDGGEDPKVAQKAMFDKDTDPAMGARMDTEKQTLAKIAKGSNDSEVEKVDTTKGDFPTKEQNTDIAKSLKDRKSDEGNTMDSETTDRGSILIGVEHGKRNPTNQAAIQAIESLPSDTKVMFVGEGGTDRDKKGRIRFNGEQNEFRNAVMNHFDDTDETSWDENADINDDSSPVFDDVANVLDGSKSKSKAAIWSNMVGQGDDLPAEDYLDEEGKDWLISQAKAGGGTEIDEFTDFDNLSDRQKEELYQLNYRDDSKYKETEISKGQTAYNDFRQKELDRKIKEAEDNGYTVIAPMGNSHVDLWRKRNKNTEAGDEFEPIESTDVTKEIPKADSAAFSGQSDIDKLTNQERKEISMKIDELNKMTQDAIAKGEKAPNYNLCKVTVPGTNLYCDNNLGIPREDMPQFKGKPQPGTPAADMPVDKNGEVDTEPLFKKMLADKGIKVLDTEIPSDALKATQSELVGSKVAGMSKALEKDPNHPSITAPIYVSRDGYVVDGHHRWAAVTSNAIKNGEATNMKVRVIDMDAKDIIPMANKFAEDQGVAAKKADANQEGPKSDISNDKTLPKPKEADTTKGGTIYSVGGGYYSDKPNGPAQYVKESVVIQKVIFEGNDNLVNLLFEDSVTKTTSGGNTIKVRTIPVKDQPKATKVANDTSSTETNTEPQKSQSNFSELETSNNDSLDSFIKNGFAKSSGAPGSPGSMLNEIVSITSTTGVLNSNKDFDYEAELETNIKKLKGTELGKENDSDNPSSGVKKSEAESVAQKYGVSIGVASKIIIATRAAQSKHKHIKTAILEKNGIKNATCIPLFGDFTGLKSQEATVTSTNGRVFLGNTEISKEEAIKIIRSGGGGDNPSDTAIFVVNKDTGDLHMTFYSDKDNVNAIVAQSTITAEAEFKKKQIDKFVEDGKITQKQSDEIKNIIDDSIKEYQKLESDLDKVVNEPIIHLQNVDPNSLVELAKKLSTGAFPDKYWNGDGKSTKGVAQLMRNSKKHMGYLPNGHATPPTDVEMMQGFIKYASDLNNTLTKTEQRVISDLSNKTNGPKLGAKLGEIRKRTVDADLGLIKKLDEQTVNMDGKQVGIGTLLEAESVAEKLHLNIMFGGDGVYQDEDAFYQESGGVAVNKQTMKNCFPFNDKNDMVSHFEVGEERETTKRGETTITGGSKIVYAISKNGERYPIGEKIQRSKSGPLGKLQTVYKYHPNVQKCFSKNS